MVAMAPGMILLVFWWVPHGRDWLAPALENRFFVFGVCGFAMTPVLMLPLAMFVRREKQTSSVLKTQEETIRSTRGERRTRRYAGRPS